MNIKEYNNTYSQLLDHSPVQDKNDDKGYFTESDKYIYFKIDDHGIKGSDQSITGRQKYRYISKELIAQKLNQLKGKYINIEHKRDITLGKVIDVFLNTKGFETKLGTKIEADGDFWGIGELFDDVDKSDLKNFIGVSTEMKNVKAKPSTNKVDGAFIDQDVYDFNYTGLAITNLPRSTRADLILNSINEQNNKDFFFNTMDQEQQINDAQLEMRIAKILEKISQDKLQHEKQEAMTMDFDNLKNFQNSATEELTNLKSFQNSTAEELIKLQNAITELSNSLSSVKNSTTPESEDTKEGESKEDEKSAINNSLSSNKGMKKIKVDW